METIPYKGAKKIKAIWRKIGLWSALFLLLLASLGFIYFNLEFRSSRLNNKIKLAIASLLQKSQYELEQRLEKARSRSIKLISDFQKGKLKAELLLPGEAVVDYSHKDIASNYQGEVYYFQPLPSGIDELVCSDSDALYYLRKVVSIYYLQRIKEPAAADFVLRAVYPDQFLWHLLDQPGGQKDQIEVRLDEQKILVSQQIRLGKQSLTLLLSYDLIALRNALQLFLWKLDSLFILIVLVSLLILLVLDPLRKKVGKIIHRSAIFISGGMLFFFLGQADLQAEFFFFPLSNLQLIIIGLAFCLILFRLNRENPIFWLLLVVEGASFALLVSGLLENAHRVDFFALNSDFVVLLFLFLLLFVNFFFLPAEKLARSNFYLLLILLVAGTFTIFLMKGDLLFWGSYLLTLFLIVLLRKKSWRGGIVLFMLSLTAFLLIYKEKEARRDRFLYTGASSLAASKDSYSRLLAREVVYELNRLIFDPAELFDHPDSRILKRAFEESLAGRENVSGAILLVDFNGQLKAEYRNDFPLILIDRAKKDRFPFWHLEEVDYNFYGIPLPISTATISVFREGEYRGYLIVQILSSQELLLDRVRREIPEAAKLNYIKFDMQGTIVENPGRINPDLSLINLHNAKRKVSFRAGETSYQGVIFNFNQGYYLLYYPLAGSGTIFSQFARIFLFYLLILTCGLFFSSRNRSYLFKSFSWQVFSFYILLSALLLLLFILFSINYNRRSVEQSWKNYLEETGNIAYRFFYSLWQEDGQISENQIYFLEKLLGCKVEIYSPPCANNREHLNQNRPTHQFLTARVESNRLLLDNC